MIMFVASSLDPPRGASRRAASEQAEEPFLVSDPAAIKALYSESAHGLPRSRNAVLTPIFGSRSIALLDGSEHLSRRRLMLPLFNGERMRACRPVVERIVTEEIESWPLGEEFPIHPRMQAVTEEMILRVVFGVAEGIRLAQLRTTLNEVLLEMSSPSFTKELMEGSGSGFDDPERRDRLEGRLQAVDELLYAEIDERRAAGGLEERDDSLSALMLARFEDGEPMSDTELRDQLMSMLIAGHETTAAALAWSFDLLLRHAEPLRRLRESLEAGDDDYLRATIAESLRLRPVVPLTGRCLSKELSVEGRTLPAGTDVMSAIWLTHTRPDLYPQPFAFRPERFLGDGPENFAWIPFGGGVRRCIGGSFAEFEMQIVLREVLTRCDLEKCDPAPEKSTRRFVTLSPAAGVPVVLNRLSPRSRRKPDDACPGARSRSAVQSV
jgi:cytochrome P450 family 135